jgi:hypothetical protein
MKTKMLSKILFPKQNDLGGESSTRHNEEACQSDLCLAEQHTEAGHVIGMKETIKSHKVLGKPLDKGPR